MRRCRGAANGLTFPTGRADPQVLAGQIDALMSGAPVDLPPIVVFGDEAVFGIRPARRTA